MSSRMNSQKGSAHLVLVVVLIVAILGALGYVAYTKFLAPKSTSSTTQTAVTTKAPGVVSSVQFATSLSSTGTAVQPTTNFSQDDKTIYVVANLAKVSPTTRIAYTRYLNDKFVDNGSIPAGKDGAKVASFAFKEKDGSKRPVGTYKVKIYTNGALEREAIFSVK